MDAGAIVENKRLGAVLALVKQQQAAHRGPPVALAGGGWVLASAFPRSVKHQPLLICVVSSRSRGRAYSADGGPGGV